MGSGRRQQLFTSICAPVVGLGLVFAAPFVQTAHAEDAWLPAILDPLPPRSAPQSVGATVGADWADGFVPPFRVGDRDRLTASAAGLARLGPTELRLGWAWLTDWTAAGGAQSGPGDFRLGTVVRVYRIGDIDLHVGWEAKLPDAADEGELGTDETDITFGGAVAWRRGAWNAQAGAGLAILGNPLRFANQDDVPLVRLGGGWAPGPVAVVVRADADLPTSRNPARAEGDMAVRYGSRWFVRVNAGVGFVPAAADWHAGAAIGYAVALPGPDSGA